MSPLEKSQHEVVSFDKVIFAEGEDNLSKTYEFSIFLLSFSKDCRRQTSSRLKLEKEKV